MTMWDRTIQLLSEVRACSTEQSEVIFWYWQFDTTLYNERWATSSFDLLLEVQFHCVCPIRPLLGVGDRGGVIFYITLYFFMFSINPRILAFKFGKPSISEFIGSIENHTMRNYEWTPLNWEEGNSCAYILYPWITEDPAIIPAMCNPPWHSHSAFKIVEAFEAVNDLAFRRSDIPFGFEFSIKPKLVTVYFAKSIY